MAVVWMIICAVLWASIGGFWGALLGVIFGPMNAAIAAALTAAMGGAAFATSFWLLVSVAGTSLLALLGSPTQPVLGMLIVAFVSGAISAATQDFPGIPQPIFWLLYGLVAGTMVGTIGSLHGALATGTTLEVALTQAIAPVCIYAIYGAGVGLLGGAVKTLLWSKFITLLQSMSGSMSGAIWSAVIGALIGILLGAVFGVVVGSVLEPAIVSVLFLVVLTAGGGLLWAWSGTYK